MICFTANVATITVSREQWKVVEEAIRLGLVVGEREAVEMGLATLRDRVKQEVTAVRLKQEADEQTERERIAANQFSLFGDTSSESAE